MRYMVDAFKEIESDLHLSPGGCAATPSPLPSLGEGRESGGGERAEERRKAALQALFKAMLHQLMTGKVRVGSDEETNDVKRMPQRGRSDGPHSY